MTSLKSKLSSCPLYLFSSVYIFAKFVSSLPKSTNDGGAARSRASGSSGSVGVGRVGTGTLGSRGIVERISVPWSIDYMTFDSTPPPVSTCSSISLFVHFPGSSSSSVS